MYPFQHALPIWHPEGGSINQYIEFQASFVVESPALCRLYLHVNTNYALYINDTFIDCGSFSDFQEDRTYDTISLKDHVTPGENYFTLYAYYQGKDSFTVKDYSPEAVFVLMEDKEELLLSLPGFPVRTLDRYVTDVPCISPQLLFSFAYDASVKESEWMRASAQPSSPFALSPRPIRKLSILPPAPSFVSLSGEALLPDTDLLFPAQRMQQAFRHLFRPLSSAAFPSENAVSLKGNDLILDLKQETVGYLLLDIDLPKNCEVLIGWGEHLEDGHVRTYVGGRNFAASLQLPEGRTTFFYPFKRIALRYLEIMVPHDHSFSLYYAGVRPAFYPLRRLHFFHSDDHLHNQIFNTSVRTLLSCMHEHYEDCPWREQALYTMDSRNQMLIGYYTFHEYDFARASLRLIAHGLRDDGYLELINPGSAPITIPSFTAIYLIQMAEYLSYSEDYSLIRELLPVCEKIADTILSRIDDTHLIPRETQKQYWTFYEWQKGLDGHSAPVSDGPAYDAPQQAFSVMALKSVSYLETALGSPRQAGKYLKAADQIRDVYHRTFFDTAIGCYRTFSLGNQKEHLAELTQALSICAGLVPDENLSEVLSHLAHPETLHLSEPFYKVTLSHSIFKYEALLKQPSSYASYVFEEIASLYGSMLNKGASTFWETIDGGDAFDNAGSLCHGWSAIPAYFYLKYVVDSRGEGTALSSSMTHIQNATARWITEPGEDILNGLPT